MPCTFQEYLDPEIVLHGPIFTFHPILHRRTGYKLPHYEEVVNNPYDRQGMVTHDYIIDYYEYI
jgi:hypothetical protein